MEKKILLIFLLISITLTSIVPSVTSYRGMVGGRKEVKDVKSNQEVQQLGQFSVEEFNRRRRHDGEGSRHLELLFAEVVAAEVQVVAGLKYYLKVRVTTGAGESRVYDSVVVVKPWLVGRGGSKKLLSFSPTRSTNPVLDLITVGGNYK